MFIFDFFAADTMRAENGIDRCGVSVSSVSTKTFPLMIPVCRGRLFVRVICHFVWSLSVALADATTLSVSAAADVMENGVFVMLLTVIVFLNRSLPGMSVKIRSVG